MDDQGSCGMIVTDESGFSVDSMLAATCQVCRVANLLKSEGVRHGDVVTLYMPTTPDLVAAMLACARIGAVHS